MSIQQIGFQAYSNALRNFQQAEAAHKAASVSKAGSTGGANSFADMLSDSIGKVNEMQMEKKGAIESFASGENQNVHELMITMQKAGLAMNMTAAVRNKVMEAYRELSKIQF